MFQLTSTRVHRVRTFAAVTSFPQPRVRRRLGDQGFVGHASAADNAMATEVLWGKPDSDGNAGPTVAGSGPDSIPRARGRRLLSTVHARNGGSR